MMPSIPLEIISTKELSNTSNTNTQAYPSPSLSPVTTFRNTMNPGFAVADSCHMPCINYLMGSINPPTSPLDALVLALEATAEELKGGLDESQHFRSASPLSQEQDSDEDPNATVPSSPTFFMKSSMLVNSDVPSLHQLPSLALPEAAFSSQASPPSASYFPTATSPAALTPSTQPGQRGGSRKMSVSSQGSIDSTSSASSGGRRKTCVCSVVSCEKRFSQVAHLRIHERCHTGTRPFVCRFDGCERSFTQLGNLKTHERKHTGERPFKCPHPGCDKTFTQLGNLKTHERIHDEVKPFMCRLPGCGKTFSQLGNLKTHTAKMHPDVAISDEELAIRTMTSPSLSASTQTDRTATMSRIQERPGTRQVVAHFNPYQRRPIHPYRSETKRLLRDIRVMLQHEECVQDLTRRSEEMEYTD